MNITSYKHLFLFIISFLLFFTKGVAQIELDLTGASDVETAAFICSKSFHIAPFQGAGNTTMNAECIPEETNAVWLNWEGIGNIAELTFIITPDNPDVNIDFVLFESDNRQEITNPDPRKCSTSTCTGTTGLRGGAVDAQANPFTCNTTTDNGFLSPAIQFNRFYALLVHSTSDDNGFTIEFGGNAEFAGPRPSIISSIPNEACYGQGVTFSLPADFDDTDIISYEWGFGEDASIPTLTTADRNENPEIIYTSNGEKTITLTVSSALGCVVSTEYTLTISDCCDTNNSLNVDTTLVSVVSCPSDADGAINIEVITSSPLDFDILWSNDETTPNISGLSAGIFGVTVSNAAGCEAILDNIVLETPDVLSLEIPDIITEDCRAGTEVVVFAAAEGGRAPYLYNFGQNQDTLPIDNASLGIGEHLITVQDASGCTDTTTMSIIPIMLEPEIRDIANAPCNGEPGSVDITEEVGTAPYTYDLGNGLTGDVSILQAIPGGGYTLIVTDANECTGSTGFIIDEPAAFTARIEGADFINPCFGDSLGTLTVVPNGGSPPYAYEWEDGSTTNERTDLPAGTYSVTITDNNDCEIVETATINESVELMATITNTSDANCANTEDGTIEISVSGGTGAYAFSLDDGVSFQALPADGIINNLAPAEYNLIVQDNNNCQTEPITTTINSPTPLSITDSIIVVTNCEANDNGGIITTVEGGASPYTYEFANPAGIFASNTTGQIIDSLPIGNYTVFVTDANGCMESLGGIQVTELALEVAVLDTSNLNCNADSSGAVELSINGATNTQDFLFDISNTGERLGDSVLTSLAAGTYEIDVFDSNGCQGTTPEITIEEPLRITLSPSFGRINCFGDSDGGAIVVPSGGTGEFIYNWSNGDTDRQIANVPAGMYSLTVTDENNCTAETSLTIQQNDPIEVSDVASIDVACPDNPNGEIQLNVIGGVAPYQYSIDGGTTFDEITILSGLTAGDYEIIIQDSEGCDTTITATIESPTSIEILALGEGCFGGTFSFSESISLTDDDNITDLAWSFGEGASMATTNGPGPHEVTYTAITTPEIQLTVTTERCGEITPTIINQVDDPTSFAIEPCCDINGITLTTSVDSTSCADVEDGSITLTVETPDIAPTTSIVWSTAEENTLNITNLSTGTYIVTVTNEATCTQTASTVIAAPTPIAFSVATTDPSCGGMTDGTISVTAMGGAGVYEYNFDNAGFQPDATVSDFPNGTYNIIIRDANNCEVFDTVTLAEKVLEIAPASFTEPTCFGDSNAVIDLTVTNGVAPFEYNVNGGGFGNIAVLSDLTAGNYSIVVMDDELCQGTIDVIVTQPDAVTVNLQTVQNISCFGERDGQLLAVASGGDNIFEYDWEVGGTNPLLTNLGPGEYTVTVTDSRDCSDTETGLIVEPTELSAQATAQAVLCFGQTNGTVTGIGVGGTAPYAYSLDGVFFQPTATFNNLAAGTYTIFVQDEGGCIVEANAVVDEPGEFSIIATQNQEVRLGEEIQLQAIVTNETGVTYVWTGPDPLTCTDCPNPRIQPSQSGTYTVTATNPGNCSATATVDVLVDFQRPVFIPNAFSPNGDGINDRFFIQGGPVISIIRRLSIYDRYGSLLYNQTNIQPNDPSIGWDGMFNGQAMNIGVYVVQAEIEFIDEEIITYTRDVTLMKAVR